MQYPLNFIYPMTYEIFSIQKSSIKDIKIIMEINGLLYENHLLKIIFVGRDIKY